MLSFSIVITLQLTILMQWKHSLSIVITLQLTVSMQLKCSFSIVIIFNCCHFATDNPHTVKTLIVSLLVQIMKFKSYLSSYHPMQKASNWKSGLDMERWLTPWRTSTHERPFTWKGNYLDNICRTFSHSKGKWNILWITHLLTLSLLACWFTASWECWGTISDLANWFKQESNWSFFISFWCYCMKIM